AQLNIKTSEPKRGNSSSQTKRSNPSQFIHSPVDQILLLQRTIGNRALEGFLKSGVIRAKLTIGQPGDVYEQEADRVADQVMRMPDLSKAQSKRVAEYDKFPSIQRTCTECEEELQRQTQNSELGYLELGDLELGDSTQEDLHRQPMDEEEEGLLRTIGVSSETPEVTPNVENQVNTIRGSEQPLPESVRTFFEPRFGQDFSQVRVHTGMQAAESAHSVNALAYTVGNDIVFGAGQYSPETDSGQKLLAHELTHTLQQAVNVKDSALTIQRQLRVEDPFGRPPNAPPGEFNAGIVGDYVSTLCPQFMVDFKGDVVPIPTEVGFCIPGVADFTTTPESCNCLCEMMPTNWKIKVDDEVLPHTHGNRADPQFETIKVHSPFAGFEVGSWSGGQSPHRISQPGFLVLGHELCGHARLEQRGTHPEGPPPEHGGRPEHEEIVKIENKIAAEHGVATSDLRGLFQDPHHGESFAKVTLSPFPSGAVSVFSLPESERQKFKLVKTLVQKTAADAGTQLKMDVVGHADQPAVSEDFNISVSKQRAISTRAELVRQGILFNSFMEVTGVGSSECSQPGDQPSCRKAEIFLFGQEGASLAHKD
ncbi:MAG: eCIS core domain-containing protein, partial [Thermodesulfobacteriota bacterium]